MEDGVAPRVSLGAQLVDVVDLEDRVFLHHAEQHQDPERRIEIERRVVHAKSNFETTGNECDIADISTLNIFMKEACSQTIRWYNRQPKHFKLTII